jgi:hypothetical protein
VQEAPALAEDWSVKSGLSETLEANDNYFLIPAPKGPTYVPQTAVSLSAQARTPTIRFGFDGDLSYNQYFGPGAADTSVPAVKQDDVTFSAEQSGAVAGDKIGASVSWRQQDVATAQLNDIGVVTTSGQITSRVATAYINRQLGAVDSLVLSASTSKVDFTSPTATPFSNLTTDATWRRELNNSSSLFASTEFNWTIPSDTPQSDVKFWKAVTGLQMRITPRLTLNGSIGIGVVDTGPAAFSAPVAIPPLAPPPSFAGGEVAARMLADVAATYKLESTTDLSLAASRSIAPDVLGVLSQRMSYSVGLARAINSVSSLSVGEQLTQATASAGQAGSDYWATNVTYARRLTPEWRSQISYNYRKTESAGVAARSNAVQIMLARDLTLLP